MWPWFWRGLGILAGITMLVMLFLFWTAWRASPFVPAANGVEIKSGINVIAIQLDILSLFISVSGIGLAVMGFVGYQSVKSGAESAAREVAAAKADQVATAAVALHMQSIKNGTGTDHGTQAPVEPGDVTPLTAEEKGE
jgi:hypothetical protein